MADDLPDAAFWLPSDFLTDEDILSDFDFSVSAPENETSSEEEDLRGLISPQSTLLGFESKNSGSSLGSPNDKKEGDSDSATLDLLKKAAGEVAKMETSNGNYSGERLFYPPRQRSPFFYRNYPSEMMWRPVAPQQQQQSKVTKKNNKKKNNGNNGNNRTLGLPQSEWPPLTGKAQSQAQTQTQAQPMLGPFIVLKRESVGTGVFLPRHVASPAQPENKSDGIETKTKSDKDSQRRISKQAKTNQLDDIRLPSEWVY